MLEEDADVRCVRRSASGGKGSSLVEAGGRIRCLGCFFFYFSVEALRKYSQWMTTTMAKWRMWEL